MSDILMRLLEALALVAGGWLVFRLASAAVLARASQAAPQTQADTLIQPGRPAVLYFTTPDCVTCKVFQRPQLRRLENMLGDRVQVVEVDAQARPELAGRWGVLSVPTTFVLDANGKPLHVNHGGVDAEKLAKQIDSAAVSSG
jgi:thioredoxin-like negative regulator of GroEL